MRGQYVLRDSVYEDDPSMRDGRRFSSMAAALREVARSVPPGRFYVWDRAWKCRVSSEGEGV